MFNEKIYNETKLIIRKYLNKNHPNSSDDDISEIVFKILKKYNTYNEEKGSYSNWVISIARNYMIDLHRKNININHQYIYSDSMVESIGIYDEATLPYETELMFGNMSSSINEDIINMIKMKYDGYNYKEIGERFNITSSTVSNKINYIKHKIKKISAL